jgi:hypothetical protein
MNHTELILYGISIAAIKINIEHPKYARIKDHNLFHFIGSFFEAIVFLVIFVQSLYWYDVFISIIAFWNYFEPVRNYTHKKPLLFVGTTSNIDKALNKAIKHVPSLKLYIHVVSIAIMLYLCYCHYTMAHYLF